MIPGSAYSSPGELTNDHALRIGTLYRSMGSYLTHRCDEDRAGPESRVLLVEEQSNRASHGLPIQEPAPASVLSSSYQIRPNTSQ